MNMSPTRFGNIAAQPSEYQTTAGTFIEHAPGVYIDSSVNMQQLVIPAAAARNGHDTAIEFTPNTVVMTYAALQAERAGLGRINGDDSDAGNAEIRERQRLNSFSFISSVASTNLGSAATKSAAEQFHSIHDTRQSAYDAMNPMTSVAVRVNNFGDGSIIVLNQARDASLMTDMAGLPLSDLVVPEGYGQAYGTWIVTHEVVHTRDPEMLTAPAPGSNLQTETRADVESLAQFSDDFTAFVYDMRALDEINNAPTSGGHQTHIWASRFRDGIVPTDADALALENAGSAVRTIAQTRLAGALPNEAALYNDPAAKYALFQNLRREGAFDGVPFGNEVVDAYLVAGERRYGADLKARIDAAASRIDPALAAAVPGAPAVSATLSSSASAMSVEAGAPSLPDSGHLGLHYNTVGAKPAPAAAVPVFAPAAPAVQVQRNGL